MIFSDGLFRGLISIFTTAELLATMILEAQVYGIIKGGNR
jgi:hypothetical protein